GLGAELADERLHGVLRGADPLPAEIDVAALGEALGVGAPADAIARLDHHDVASRVEERARRAEPRETRSDDEDVVASVHRSASRIISSMRPRASSMTRSEGPK